MSMGMSMNYHVRQSLCLSQKQELRQSVQIRQAITLSLRLELIQALRGIRYTPRAECPECGRKLTTVEIIRGFNRDPNDYTTCCSACGTRFEPKLTYSDWLGTIEMPFYCSYQALCQLRGNERFSPEELQKKMPAAYHSAIVHHGTLRRVFALTGVSYDFEEVADWKEKIRPFLGRLPDTVIAEAAGVTSRDIAKERKKHNVPRFRSENLLSEEIDN